MLWSHPAAAPRGTVAAALAALLLGPARSGAAATAGEVLVALKSGYVGLSTRGPSAFRLRFDINAGTPAYESPLVAPDEGDAEFQSTETGITAAFGAVKVEGGQITLTGPSGAELTRSLSVAPGVLRLSGAGALFGGGACPENAKQMQISRGTTVTPIVCNSATLAPYYYSTDGYGALATLNGSDQNTMPVSFTPAADGVAWKYDPGRHDFEMYLMPAATFAEGTLKYYALIGAPAVLPRYAFGFIASRWGWKDKGYMEWIINKFREDSFPIDAIITDFEWFTTKTDYPFEPGQGFDWYEDFGVNPALFDDFEGQTRHYRDDLGIHFGAIRKPRLGNTQLIKQAADRGWILDGGEPAGTYPPEWDNAYAKGRNIDFSQQAARDWYAEQMAPFYAQGASFWWNDEGETDYFTNHWWNMAEVQALASVDASKRFYSLNRAWTPGMARLGAAAWTGDIMATWEDLQTTPGMMLNWIVSGAPYVACDIGGFGGNTTSFLLSRWMQVGAFMPQMRIHSVINAIPHWPWRFGPNAAHAIKKALELRYRLSPYHYSWAHKMYRKEAMWIRPMAMDFPDDKQAASTSTQWMDGAILVAPILDEESEHQVYLPNGSWYELFTHKVKKGPTERRGNSGLDEIPAYVRPGTIVTLGPVIQHMGELPGGALKVHVYAGADAEFELVEDDGDTYLYKDGEVRNTLFRWDNAAGELSWKASGSFAGASAFTEVEVTVFDGIGESPKTITSDKQDLGDSGSAKPRKLLKRMDVLLNGPLKYV